MLLLGCNLFSTANGAVFDIGDKLESDMEIIQFQPFTSGALVRADKHEINNTSLIFDGNLSTGIDQKFNDNLLYFRIYFLQSLLVNNITIK